MMKNTCLLEKSKKSLNYEHYYMENSELIPY
jgi:hypothetical protein